MNSPEPAEPATPPAPAVPAAGAPPLGRQAKWGVALLVVCALAALFWPRGDGKAKDPGGYLLDAQGKATPLGTRLSPVTLVHFWATWCPPCINEIPAVQRLSHDFSKYHDFGIVMIAVSDSSDKVDTFLGPGAEMVLYDPKWDVANRYGTNQLPETYLVVQGQVVEKFVGATNWDAPEVRQKLAAYLGDGAGGVPPQPAGSGS
jgi:thiol-disulfide isomerase/thioredoxin